MTNEEFLAILNHIQDAVGQGIKMIERGGGAPPEPSEGGDAAAAAANKVIAQANLLKARKQIDESLAKIDETGASHLQELRGRSEQMVAFVDFNSGCK